MIKEHDSEWASVSDLMASTIAILIIFLVALFLLEKPKKPSLQEERDEKTRVEINQILKEFNSEVNSDPKTILFDVDTAAQSITLKHGAFESGYPCLIHAVDSTIRMNSEKIKHLLVTHAELVITIEGYADTSTFYTAPKIPCSNKYFYNDNVTLSLARAEQTRDILISDWQDRTLTERVAALGYGATKQLPDKGMEDNRRVVFRVEFREKPTCDERAVVRAIKLIVGN